MEYDNTDFVRKLILVIVYYFLISFFNFSLDVSTVGAIDSYVKIPIAPIANIPITEGRLNFPTGDNVLFSGSSIPFNIGQKYFNGYPDIYAKLGVSVSEVSKVYFLLVAGGTNNTITPPRKWGEIKLDFDDNSSYKIDLYEQINLREWILDYSTSVKTTTDPNVQEIWRGKTPEGNGPVVVDMLTILLPTNFLSKILKNIEFIDSFPGLPSYHILGVTINGKGSNPPVVLIPGLGASWSYKGLVENRATGYGDWKLMPVFTENYQALLGTFKNAGLVDGQTLFTFAYDWRQPVLTSAVWLNNYLTNVVKTKANIVGHSLGGLVARACIEKVNGCKDKIEKFISVGSPHLGAVDAYYLWEGGEILETNLLKRTMENVLLRVNAKSFAHPKDIIQNIIPSIRDILPIFDYISGKSYVSMSESAKNKFLGSVGTGQTKDVATIVYGNTVNTPRWLTTVLPTAAETKLGLWVDGKPTGSTSDVGDGTVLGTSSQIPNIIGSSFNSGHAGLVSDALPQQKILDTFGLAGTIVTPATSPTKGLFFFVQSPATLTITGAGTQIDEKTVAISDPTDQNYQTTVTGTGLGSYSLQVGSFTANSQSWQEVSGNTSLGKTDNFTVNFTKVVDLNGTINLNVVRTKILGLVNFSSQRGLLLGIDRVISYVNQQNYIMARRELETLYQTVFGETAKTANTVTRTTLLQIGENLINAYEIILTKGSINISQALAQTEINRAQKLVNKTVLISSTLRAQNILEANKKLELANNAYSSSLYPRALLLARSIQYLLQ